MQHAISQFCRRPALCEFTEGLQFLECYRTQETDARCRTMKKGSQQCRRALHEPRSCMVQAKLEASNGVLKLPLIKNKKTVNPRDSSSPPVFQLETAMGSAIECFDDAGAVVVPRERFAPVKTTNDLFGLRSDAYKARLIPEPSHTEECTSALRLLLSISSISLCTTTETVESACRVAGVAC